MTVIINKDWEGVTISQVKKVRGHKKQEIAGEAINTKPDENVDFSPAFALSLQIYLMSENQEE